MQTVDKMGVSSADPRLDSAQVLLGKAWRSVCGKDVPIDHPYQDTLSLIVRAEEACRAKGPELYESNLRLARVLIFEAGKSAKGSIHEAEVVDLSGSCFTQALELLDELKPLARRAPSKIHNSTRGTSG